MSITSEDFDQLREENKQLRKELNELQGKRKHLRKKSWWFTKKFSSAFAGKWLKSSFVQLYKEIPEKNIQTETLADVTASLLWRVTRIGILTLGFAILPTVILLFQTNLLVRQNKILAKQSVRLDQQTNLAEANRRGTAIMEMSNIMNQVDNEISLTGSLRNATKSRILTHIQALKPYKFLENDALIENPLSPERAQLFLFLATSRLTSNNKIEIFKQSKFAYTDLKGAYLNLINVAEAKLPYSRFDAAEILGSTWDGVEMQGSSFMKTHLEGNTMLSCDFKETTINNSGWFQNKIVEGVFGNANFNSTFLHGIDFRKCNFFETNFENTVLSYCSFNEVVNIEFANWNGAIVNDANWLYDLAEKKVKGADQLLDTYKIGKEVNIGKEFQYHPLLDRFLSMNKGKTFYRLVKQ